MGASLWSGGRAIREGRLPFRIPFRLAFDSDPDEAARRQRAAVRDFPVARQTAAPVVVVRFPRIWLPAPGLLDRYISRIYARVVGLSFLALLGLFYISTFIDRSEKIFKGQATTR